MGAQTPLPFMRSHLMARMPPMAKNRKPTKPAIVSATVEPHAAAV